MTEAVADDGKDSGRFEDLAAEVAGGLTIRAAAAVLGIPERTAYRWSGESEFRQRVARLRSAALDATVGKITEATSQAVDRLVDLLNDPQFGLQAAKAILTHVAPLSDLGELRQRVDALEAER